LGDIKGGDFPAHTFAVRVYIEDTDLGGIVYYANYLKFIERARSEWVRAQGMDQGLLRTQTGVMFVVRRVEADYLRPAHFGDLLEVRTALIALGGARIILQQDIWRGESRIFAARVVLVCLGADGHAVRLPEPMRALLA